MSIRGGAVCHMKATSTGVEAQAWLTRSLKVLSRLRVSAARARVFEGTGVLVAQRAIAGGGLMSIVGTCLNATGRLLTPLLDSQTFL